MILNDKTSVTVNTVTVNHSDRTISLHSADKLITTMPIHEAEMIADAVRSYYCRLDVEDYFTDERYDSAILENTMLIDDITDTYANFRNHADGGEYEDSMHWTECLDKAVEIYADQISKYAIKENDT